MKNNRFKLILIAVVALVSVWSIWPTYRDYALTQKLKSFHSAEDSLKFAIDNREAIEQAKDKSLKLGLDLKGGMHLVMEVDILDLVEQKAWNKDATFTRIMADVKKESAEQFNANVVDLVAAGFKKENIRLSRYFYDMRDSDQEIVNKLNGEAKDALTRAREIIRNRIDQYGVAEPVIQTQGSQRLVIELSGVTDEARVRRLLMGTAKLEFKLVKDSETLLRAVQRIGSTPLVAPAANAVATAPVDSSVTTAPVAAAPVPAAPAPQAAAAGVKKLSDVIGMMPNGQVFTPEYARDQVTAVLNRPDVQALLPQDTQLLLAAKPEMTANGEKYFPIYLVQKTPELTGGVITEAKATFSAQDNQPEVSMSMNDEGTSKWARITGANIGKQIAIVLDSAVYSAPVVQSRIPSGNSVINGIGDLNEAKDLEIILKAGALPAPVRILEERTVGPSLGADYIRAGMYSLIWGFTAVAIFMILYYNKAGIAADLALVLNILVVISVLAGFSAALTLPGIAGIVLTMGMAVDANVLIYERIREELGEGKSLRMAIDAGYSRAFSSILDSHVTTLAAAFLLYVYGVGPIQGFAVTLMIGTAASLFTAIVVTRSLFDLLVGSKFMNEKSFG
ncbi:protein translocase subunit SecD [Chlorobaculum thiosulfatiphilum]|uniref:Protein translocase subunit SecD n=1 Tax=Chlorobaculum thiosulfatiphilum TaxID=115852 RepID=A0A5C4S7A2_CHLTI|nr:protein translocase subunit SecD [Chlorobaculum thiosulfatiphilum]TNJ39037.1 protein translocase subunit SecD [Chlorobaculum thiosulfatiphilum]